MNGGMACDSGSSRTRLPTPMKYDETPINTTHNDKLRCNKQQNEPLRTPPYLGRDVLAIGLLRKALLSWPAILESPSPPTEQPGRDAVRAGASHMGGRGGWGRWGRAPRGGPLYRAVWDGNLAP